MDKLSKYDNYKIDYDINAEGAFRLISATFALAFKKFPVKRKGELCGDYRERMKKHRNSILELSKRKKMIQLYCDCSDNFEAEGLSKLLKDYANETYKKI